MWETAKNTFYFLILYIPAHVIYGLLLALLIHSVKNDRVSTAYRSFLYLPVVLPLPIVAYGWKWMYDPTIGVFNHILVDILNINWPYTGRRCSE